MLELTLTCHVHAAADLRPHSGTIPVCVSVCARMCFVRGKDQAQTQAKIIVPDGKKTTNALAETSLLWLSPALGG